MSYLYSLIYVRDARCLCLLERAISAFSWCSPFDLSLSQIRTVTPLISVQLEPWSWPVPWTRLLALTHPSWLTVFAAICPTLLLFLPKTKGACFSCYQARAHCSCLRRDPTRLSFHFSRQLWQTDNIAEQLLPLTFFVWFLLLDLNWCLALQDQSCDCLS